MALKPTTNERCPLSAGHTRPLEADSHQVSAWSDMGTSGWYTLNHCHPFSFILLYLKAESFALLAVFFLLIPFSCERLR